MAKIHSYLHAIYENAVDIKDKIENEAILQKIIQKREHISQAFPNLKHLHFDISNKSLNEIIATIRNKK